MGVLWDKTSFSHTPEYISHDFSVKFPRGANAYPEYDVPISIEQNQVQFSEILFCECEELILSSYRLSHICVQGSLNLLSVWQYLPFLTVARTDNGTKSISLLCFIVKNKILNFQEKINCRKILAYLFCHNLNRKEFCYIFTSICSFE